MTKKKGVAGGVVHAPAGTGYRVWSVCDAKAVAVEFHIVDTDHLLDREPVLETRNHERRHHHALCVI